MASRGTGRSPRCPGRPLRKARAGPLCYLASPDDAVRREIVFARARSGKYGTPLDSRRAMASVDALLAMAVIAPKGERESFAADVLRAMNETPARLPAGDRYDADTARIAGGQARPTLGAVFAPVLLHERVPQR